MFVGRRNEKELRRVRGPAGNNDQVAGVLLDHAVPLGDDLRDRRPGLVRLELQHLGVCEQRDVRMLERRPNPEHVGVGFAVDGAGESVAVLTADAGAVRHVLLVQPDTTRSVERVVARRLEIVRELLDPRLVRDGRKWVWRACVRLGGITAVLAVHLV